MIAVELCRKSFTEMPASAGEIFLSYFQNNKLRWLISSEQLTKITNSLPEHKKDLISALATECIDQNRTLGSGQADDIPTFTIGTKFKNYGGYINIFEMCSRSKILHELLCSNACEVRAKDIDSTEQAQNIICSIIDLPKKKKVMRIYNRFTTECTVSRHIKSSRYENIEVYTYYEKAHAKNVTSYADDHKRTYGDNCNIKMSSVDLHERRIIVNDKIFLELDNGFESPRKDCTDWKLNIYNNDDTLQWILQKNKN